MNGAAPASPDEPDWFEKWFGEDYLAIYPHRDAREADAVVEMLHRKMEGKKIGRVLDLACGAGRHSRALRKHWWTTGLDLSQTLLFVARSEDRAASYVRGDMRRLPFREEAFALVVNLFTSFGYFSDDADHRRVLAEVSAVTEKGGTFVLDYLNAEQVAANLTPSDERVVNGVVVEQKRHITPDGKFVEKRITLRGQEKSFVERVRLFSRLELERLLDESGFDVSETLGDYSAGPWSPGSPRTILLSVRR